MEGAPASRCRDGAPGRPSARREPARSRSSPIREAATRPERPERRKEDGPAPPPSRRRQSRRRNGGAGPMTGSWMAHSPARRPSVTAHRGEGGHHAASMTAWHGTTSFRLRVHGGGRARSAPLHRTRLSGQRPSTRTRSAGGGWHRDCLALRCRAVPGDGRGWIGGPARHFAAPGTGTSDPGGRACRRHPARTLRGHGGSLTHLAQGAGAQVQEVLVPRCGTYATRFFQRKGLASDQDRWGSSTAAP